MHICTTLTDPQFPQHWTTTTLRVEENPFLQRQPKCLEPEPKRFDSLFEAAKFKTSKKLELSVSTSLSLSPPANIMFDSNDIKFQKPSVG